MQPSNIKEEVLNGQQITKQKEQAFMDELEKEKNKFLTTLLQLNEKFTEVKTYSDYTNVRNCFKEVNDLKDRLDKATDKIKSFN